MSILFNIQDIKGNKHVKQKNEVDMCCDLKVGDLEAREPAGPSVWVAIGRRPVCHAISHQGQKHSHRSLPGRFKLTKEAVLLS